MLTHNLSSVGLLIGFAEKAPIHVFDVMITSNNTLQYQEDIVLSNIDFDTVDFPCKAVATLQQQDSLRLKYISDQFHKSVDRSFITYLGVGIGAIMGRYNGFNKVEPYLRIERVIVDSDIRTDFMTNGNVQYNGMMLGYV